MRRRRHWLLKLHIVSASADWWQRCELSHDYFLTQHSATRHTHTVHCAPRWFRWSVRCRAVGHLHRAHLTPCYISTCSEKAPNSNPAGYSKVWHFKVQAGTYCYILWIVMARCVVQQCNVWCIVQCAHLHICSCVTSGGGLQRCLRGLTHLSALGLVGWLVMVSHQAMVTSGLTSQPAPFSPSNPSKSRFLKHAL